MLLTAAPFYLLHTLASLWTWQARILCRDPDYWWDTVWEEEVGTLKQWQTFSGTSRKGGNCWYHPWCWTDGECGPPPPLLLYCRSSSEGVQPNFFYRVGSRSACRDRIRRNPGLSLSCWWFSSWKLELWINAVYLGYHKQRLFLVLSVVIKIYVTNLESNTNKLIVKNWHGRNYATKLLTPPPFFRKTNTSAEPLSNGLDHILDFG